MQQMDTVPSVGISFLDLLRYNESEAKKWRAWLEAQPSELLDIPFGNPAQRMGTVREMIWHTFMTEWVYACVLNGEPYTIAGTSSNVSRLPTFSRSAIGRALVYGNISRTRVTPGWRPRLRFLSDNPRSAAARGSS